MGQIFKNFRRLSTGSVLILLSFIAISTPAHAKWENCWNALAYIGRIFNLGPMARVERLIDAVFDGEVRLTSLDSADQELVYRSLTVKDIEDLESYLSGSNSRERHEATDILTTLLGQSHRLRPRTRTALVEASRKALEAEGYKLSRVPENRDELRDALVTLDYVRKMGMDTERGAHGKGLSWKHLGIAPVERDGKTVYRVVGYGNPQHFHPPFDHDRGGVLYQISVASHLDPEVLRKVIEGTVTREELEALKPDLYIPKSYWEQIPEKDRDRVRNHALRVIRAALDAEPTEMTERQTTRLWNHGAIDQPGMQLMLGGNDYVGTSIIAPSGSRPVGKEMNLSITPGEPILIGRSGLKKGDISFLDEKYKVYELEGEKTAGPTHILNRGVSRLQCMLEADKKDRGVWVINETPTRGGGKNSPTNATVLTTTKASRRMESGERFLIEHGTEAMITLPNGLTITVKPY